MSTGKIFVNYRRGDDPGFTGRLFDRLEAHFSSENIFMDVDSIPPGMDFVRVLEEWVSQCDVFLAVIGQGWLTAADTQENRRLDSESDFVRIEIEAALKRDIRIIPVLVNDADMPRSEELPECLKPLARRNAVRLTHERFGADTAGLIKALDLALAEVGDSQRLAAEQAEAEAEHEIEIARQKSEEFERVENERRRLEAVAALSPEEIKKAEELVNWDYIKDRKNVDDFRDHIARFPDGVCAHVAQAKLEELAWVSIEENADKAALSSYLEEFPGGANASAAQEKLDALILKGQEAREEQADKQLEAAAWVAIMDTSDAVKISAFLEKWPNGIYAQQAKDKLSNFNAPKSRWWTPLIAPPYMR